MWNLVYANDTYCVKCAYIVGNALVQPHLAKLVLLKSSSVDVDLSARRRIPIVVIVSVGQTQFFDSGSLAQIIKHTWRSIFWFVLV